MKNYSSIEVVTSGEIDKYIKKGWEIIDTTRYSYDGGPNDVELKYHIGYPLQKKYEELLSIVKLFEEHGFKEKLFTKIAEDEGVNLEEFSTGGGFALDQSYSVLEVIKKYENVVNDKKNMKFYKKVHDDNNEF